MEKRGLSAALAAAGLSARSPIGFVDEMRVGLHGMVRRVWGRRGVQVRQRLQINYQWRYLVLVVDGRSGRIGWNWNQSMRADDVIPLVRGAEQTTDLAALVWDGAPSHRDERLGRIPLPRIILPPYAPELNPAERVFEELRAEVEGVVYGTLDAKVAAIAARLERWDADPAAVRQLAGWSWLTAAADALPDPDQVPIAA